MDFTDQINYSLWSFISERPAYIQLASTLSGLFLQMPRLLSVVTDSSYMIPDAWEVGL
jgi:hypothetical protein